MRGLSKSCESLSLSTFVINFTDFVQPHVVFSVDHSFKRLFVAKFGAVLNVKETE